MYFLSVVSERLFPFIFELYTALVVAVYLIYCRFLPCFPTEFTLFSYGVHPVFLRSSPCFYTVLDRQSLAGIGLAGG
jgi:hypothetical protein